MIENTLSKPKQLLFFGIAIGIALVTYSNHFTNPFEFDDNHTIVNNLYIRDIHNISTFFSDASTISSLPANQAYRPGLTTLNAIDYWIGGETNPNPLYYHISIFISFIVLGLVLFAFVKKILAHYFTPKTAITTSLLVTLWFWLHTANSATINYIIQRADSFSTLMVVSAFCLYLYFPKWQKFYLYMVPVVVGFSVKEPTIMFVGLLIVYKILFEQKVSLKEVFTSQKGILLQVIGQCTAPLLLSLVLIVFSRKMTPSLWSSGSSDVLHYALSQPYVILHYFNNFILPANLVIDSDWTIVTRVFDDRVIIGFAFLFGLLYVAFKTSQNHAPIAFGILWFLIALLPTSSFIPLAEVLNDHRPFFGYIGLFIAFAYGITYLYNRYHSKFKLLFLMGIPLVLVLHARATYQHNSKWHSPESIWKDATVNAPLNGRAWMNYGLALMERGSFTEAEKAFTKAIQLWPEYPYALINIAILKNTQNAYEEAEIHFKKAIAIDPILPEGYYYYADFLYRRNRINEANQYLEKGLMLSPKHNDLLKLKATMEQLASKGGNFYTNELEKAAAMVKNNPNHENYLNLSLQYYNNKQFDKCIEACYKALQLKPDYDLAYNNICSAYIELKNWDKAIEAGKKGISINPNNSYLKQNLAYALQQQKQQP